MAIPSDPLAPQELAAAVDKALEPVLAANARATQQLLHRVSSSQLQALLVIQSAGPINVGVLAERLAMLPSSASRLCQRLLAADLIVRYSGSDDRREVMVTLTPAGARMLSTVRTERVRALQQALSGLSARQRRTVLHGVQLLAAQLDDPPEDAAPARGYVL